MWSVNWILKAEVEAVLSARGSEDCNPGCTENLGNLTDYLVIGSDAFNFHLFHFRRNQQGEIFMEKLAERKLSPEDIQFHQRDIMRFSMVKKLKGKALLVAALQHSKLAVILKVVRLRSKYEILCHSFSLPDLHLLLGVEAAQTVVAGRDTLVVFLFCHSRSVSVVSFQTNRIEFKLLE